MAKVSLELRVKLTFFYRVNDSIIGCEANGEVIDFKNGPVRHVIYPYQFKTLGED